MPDSLPMPGTTSGPPPTLLPDDHPDTVVARQLRERVQAQDLAAQHPASSLAWAVLADEAFAAGRFVDAYAYARTGYHRGLDALRRNGWKGYGPVPWSHAPNRGFLRCVTVLAKAAERIGEVAEEERLTQLLRDCDPSLAG